MPSPDTSAKVIVITGASSGIGAAVAKHLGRAGHAVVLAARREELLKEVARATGAEARWVVTDVRRRDDIERLRDEAIRACGRVDVWINNAGRGISKPALDLTDDDFDEMMSVNVKSALYGMQAIVPYFISREAGHIINISSVLGRVPVAPIRSAYNAAKAALNALTANVRVDLRETHPGIHVTLVMPGLVSTGFANSVMGDPAESSLPGGPPPGVQPQTAEQVAAAIADTIDQPVAEVFTNPRSADLVRAYYADVAAFEGRHRVP